MLLEDRNHLEMLSLDVKSLRLELIHREVRRLKLYLESEQAARNLRLAFHRAHHAAWEREWKYRPDQPRAPKGTPIGGQWVVDPNSARQRRLLGDILRTAGIAEDLEELGGGAPRTVSTPKGATQFIFPNGMMVRFDLLPGQFFERAQSSYQH